MHFIVTGGAGFIGSHLTEALIGDGHEVTVVDNLCSGFRDNLPKHKNINFIEENILACDPQIFSKPVDGIAHLAATPSVTDSWSNPLGAHDNNLTTTLHVVGLCMKLNIKRLVFASSAAVYGNQNKLPINEVSAGHTIAPYGLQKFVSEEYARLFSQKSNLTFIGLRLFNVFGPRQVASSPYSGVISIFIDLIRKGLPVKVYGDGYQTRDFIYVKDVASAFYKALLHNFTNANNLSCNIATGKSKSLLDLFNALKKNYPSSKSDISFCDERLGDVRHSLADVSLAKNVLGFSSIFSLENGLKQLVQFSEKS